MTMSEIERCPVCDRDWRMPFNHRQCVERLEAEVKAMAQRLKAPAPTWNP